MTVPPAVASEGVAR